MVTLQVDEVNALFDEVEKLRKNNWQVRYGILLYMHIQKIYSSI